MANPDVSSSAGISLSPQGTVKFKVPQQYWEHFRAGVIFDLALDTKARVEHYSKGYEHRVYGYPPEQQGYVGLEGEEHTGPLRCVAQSAGLLVEMEDACPAARNPERDISIEGDPEAMIFALHALANEIAGPMFTLALDCEAGAPNPKAREWSVIALWAMDAMESLEPARLAATKLRAEESKEAKS
jgi:hypothetical protein